MAATVQVKGLNEALRALSKAGDDFEDLKDANQELGSIIARKAAAIVPKRSGALEQSIKANRAKKKVQIKAGGARVPYAGVIEYGWRARNIAPQPYIRKAAFEDRDLIKTKYEENIKSIINKYNLG